MKSTDKAGLTIVQMNDTHAYLDIHCETGGYSLIATTVKHIRKESQEKVDLIVSISHLGFPQDMKLLSEVHGVDVYLSSHTHYRLNKTVLNGKYL